MTEISSKLSKNAKTILIIVALFIVCSFAYFPALIKGNVLEANDIKTSMGMSKEVVNYRAATGHDSNWTNSMFGGMPTYLISARYQGNINNLYFSIVNAIPRPANYLIVNFCLFFLLGMIFGAAPWLSFAGALAYGLTSFVFILLDAGHMSKVNTLSYFSLLISGVYLAYNNKVTIGTILAMVGLSLMLTANHPQMTYYCGIMVLIMAITYFVYAYKEKTVPKFLKSSVFLVVAAIIAIGINFGPLVTTYEYGKYSTRGKSDLKAPDVNQTAGLDRNYILEYSYDFGEAVTAFIPRFKGGGMSEPLSENSETYKLLEQSQGEAQAKKIVQALPLYWGTQPIAGGPFYYGAVLCFLFVLGLFIVKGKEKWWIVSVFVVSLLLSLGKNLPFLANLMIDYFPGYSKFRDVKNIIVIQQFAMALMGILAIKEVYLRNIDSKKFLTSLKYSFAIAGGFALLFAVIPGLAGNFKGNSDAQLIQSGWPQQLIDAIVADRRSILRMDSFRTFIFVALAAAGLWAFWTKKIKAQHALILWVVLILADLWPINKRYLNDDKFVAKRKMEVPFTATTADTEILKDKDPDYRVLNMSVNPFSDASTSYYHKSIGGYHGAKMKRYQELIENNISPEMQQIASQFKNIKTQADIDAVFEGLNALNMLNTRYIIYNPKAAPLVNIHALGNAWFVNKYQLVDNADQEIKLLGTIDPQQVALIDKQFGKDASATSISPDNTAKIELTSYAPNKLVYKSSSATTQLAVFSEIYYPKGWVATIDGAVKPHFRANYVLRSMLVPAGNHEIVFEFKPKSYSLGNKIAMVSSLLFLLAVGGLFFFEIKKTKKSKVNEE